MKYLIAKDHDETSGVTTEYWGHEGGKKVTVRRWQDAEPIIISNTRQFNSRSSKGKLNLADGLGTKVASIPMGFVEEHLAKTGANIMTCTEAQLKRILNDPEYKRLRTAPGRL